MQKYGGVVTLDEIYLKFQEKNCCDFNLYIIEMKEKEPCADVYFQIKTTTHLLLEAPDCPASKNIRTRITAALPHKYEALCIT